MPTVSGRDLAQAKKAFLAQCKVGNEDEAMKNALRAALQRNPTYIRSIDSRERMLFRNRWAELLRATSQQYSLTVSDKVHAQNITYVSTLLSSEYGNILLMQSLRIGTSQKALNLYLKFLWCLGVGGVSPPHCPIDRIVLQAAGIEGSWTHLNSALEYSNWVQHLKQYAAKQGYGHLADWELVLWNG